MYRKLKKRGVLGMNARIGLYMGRLNRREDYPLVDDKTKTADLAIEHGIPIPENYFIFQSYGDLHYLPKILASYQSFVVKPARGAMGNGIVVIDRREGNTFFKPSGEKVSLQEIKYRISQTMSGLYSLNNLPDKAILQYKVELHSCFESYAYQGIPDIRVIVFKGYPIMAMTRLPTTASDGRANLHQGAVGAGLDMVTGQVCSAACRDEIIQFHPDTGQKLSTLKIPFWQQILTIASHCYDITGMGYLGVDLVLDANQGPMVMEMNARPGLSIQVANQAGLRRRLEIFEPLLDSKKDYIERVDHAQKIIQDHPELQTGSN